MQKEVGLLQDLVADLDREKRAAVKDQRQRADVAECERKNEKVLRKGVELTNFPMRLELLQQGEVMMLINRDIAPSGMGTKHV